MTSGDIGRNKVSGTVNVSHAMFKTNMVKMVQKVCHAMFKTNMVVRVEHFNRLRINLPQAFLDRVGDGTSKDFSSVMRGWLPAFLPGKLCGNLGKKTLAKQ